MKILHVMGSVKAAGGVETYLLNVFRYLQRDDLQLEVCYMASESGALKPEIEDCGVAVWGCHFDLRRPYAFERKFRRALAERGPYDIVHSHLYDLSGPALAAAAAAGVPHRIAHYHNTSYPKNDLLRRMYRAWLQRDVRRHATAIAGCAWAALQAFYPTLWNTDPRMRVLRYGVPQNEFPADSTAEAVRAEFGIPPQARVIGHVGRFQTQKNHVTLIEVLRRVMAEEPDVYALLVGHGELQPQIKDIVDRHALSERIIFTGVRRDVFRLLLGMDLFLFPSLHEGFGIVLTEAQTAGLPVVASQIPAHYESVASIYHPYFRAPLDITGLTDATRDLLARAATDPQLAEQSRTFGRQFTIENSIQGLLALWGVPGAAAPADPAGGKPDRLLV